MIESPDNEDPRCGRLYVFRAPASDADAYEAVSLTESDDNAEAQECGLTSLFDSSDED